MIVDDDEIWHREIRVLCLSYSRNEEVGCFHKRCCFSATLENDQARFY